MILTPVLDTHVRSDTPDTAYPNASPLWVKGINPEAITYLVFDVPALNGTAEGVSLTLNAIATVTGTWSVYSCPELSSTVTYNTRPQLGPKLVDLSGVIAGSNLVTIPPGVVSSGKVCFALVKTGSGVFKFDSAENANLAPVLGMTVVPTHGPQPWPMTPVPTLEPTNATNILYVDSAGNDSNVGSLEAPVASVSRAVALAVDGTEIRVKAGVYNEAVNFASKGSKHIWLRADSAQRFTLDGGNTLQVGIDTRGATGGVVIEGAEIRNFRNQGVILGNNSVLRHSIVRDIFADWTTRAPLSSEDPNQSGVKLTGTDAIVESNVIHSVGQHGEARGILLLSAERCLVTRNQVYHARKEGIRDAFGGLDNEISYNHFVACWAGISIETTMGTPSHRNTTQDCTVGIFTKHTAATTPGAFPPGTTRPLPVADDPSMFRWIIVEDNVFIRSYVTTAWLHDNLPFGDFVCFRRNTLAGSHRRYVLTTQDPTVRGPNYIQDENKYVVDMPNWTPPLVYKGDGLQGNDLAWHASTLAELQAEHPALEPNGTEASIQSVNLDPLPVEWTRPDPVLARVSNKPTQAARLFDGDPSNPWEAGLDSAGKPVDAGARITLDYGKEVTFTHLQMHPWAHGSNQCPRSLDLSFSLDDVTYTPSTHLVFNDNEGAGYWWKLPSPVTARYVDLSNIVDFASANGLTTRAGMQIGELGVGCLSLQGLPLTQVV